MGTVPFVFVIDFYYIIEYDYNIKIYNPLLISYYGNL